MHVVVEHAEGLPPADMTGKADPYVRLRWDGDRAPAEPARHVANLSQPKKKKFKASNDVAHKDLVS